MLAPLLLSSVSEAISGLPIGVWSRKFVILTIRQFADDTYKITRLDVVLIRLMKYALKQELITGKG